MKKTECMLLYFCFFTFALFAQQPTQGWVARYVKTPSTPDLFAPFSVVDKNGNSIFAGTNKINDSINILVVKNNSSGIYFYKLVTTEYSETRKMILNK